MEKQKLLNQVILKLNTPKYFTLVRKNAEEIATHMGFDEEAVFDLALVVDEAYVNSIEHGAEGKTEAKVDITFSIYENKLEITIKDGGCGFDMSAVKVPDNLESLCSTRGRGLGLMKLLTDEFSYESHPGEGTSVTFAKYL